MTGLELLGVFGPLVVNAANGLINRFIVPETVKPQTVEDVAKLAEIDVNKRRALNELDHVDGPTSEWVNNIIRLQRPIVIFSVLATFVTVHVLSGISVETIGSVDSLAAIIFSWLFGERFMINKK